MALAFADKALDREYVLYSNARITKMISLSTGFGRDYLDYLAVNKLYLLSCYLQSNL